MDNINIDENTINNIKNMVNSGNISDAVSQISPEMIQNFSKIFSQNTNSENDSNASNPSIRTEDKKLDSNSNVHSNESQNLNNIDMNTIINMSKIIGNMNNSKNDPRTNLLNSLKPYLRNGKKESLDNYINLLNMAKVAEIMNNTNNKENKK